MAQNSNQNGAQTAPATQSKAIAAMKDELASCDASRSCKQTADWSSRKTTP